MGVVLYLSFDGIKFVWPIYTFTITEARLIFLESSLVTGFIMS